MSPKKTSLLITSALAGGAAHGAIVYTNFNNLVFNNYLSTSGTNFSLTSGFDSQYNLLYQDQNVQKPQITGDGTGTFVYSRTWLDTNHMDMGYRTYDGLPLTPGGVMVGPSMPDVNSLRQGNGITNLLAQPNGYFNDRPISTDGPSQGTDHIDYLGDWGQSGTSSGYVGLVMIHGGATNYGWAHFTWSDPSTSYSANSTLTLIDAAFESNPNTGIITGAGTPGLPVINSVTSSAPYTTNYAGASIELGGTVSAGLTYQWQAGVVGSGIYTNLTDGATFSGSKTVNLCINSAGTGNTADYVLVASNGSGSVTSSPPATIIVSASGSTPTTGNGWYQAFQGQTDYTYAGGRQNVSYRASNGKDYWLINELATGTMNPADDSFSSGVGTVDNQILLQNGNDCDVTAVLSLDHTNAVPENANIAYQMKDLFEANGSLYALLQRTDTGSQFSQQGGQFAAFNIQSNGMLTYQYLVPAFNTGTNLGVNNPATIQWSSSAVAQGGFVYVFGQGDVINSADATVAETYLARIASANITYTNLWTFWNGSSWDVNEANSAAVNTNAFDMVRYYKGNWVAVAKPDELDGTNIFAYTALQPQGPYSTQDIFADPTNAVLGQGELTIPATGDPDYFYSANPALHPEDSLTSGNLLVSIGYEDTFQPDQYDTSYAGLYKPRFYEVTLTNLVISSTLQVSKTGTNVIVNWSSGTLEQATNILGPWTTNSANPPYTNTSNAKQLFFRTIQ